VMELLLDVESLQFVLLRMNDVSCVIDWASFHPLYRWNTYYMLLCIMSLQKEYQPVEMQEGIIAVAEAVPTPTRVRVLRRHQWSRNVLTILLGNIPNTLRYIHTANIEDSATIENVGNMRWRLSA
jgi:hypothetical protein